MFCRGSDQGGGVGGVNYTEYSDGSELNYKIYNLRGDVIKTVDANKQTRSFSNYYAFGEYKDVIGDIKTDRHRANTKVEDSGNLLNEGKRFRQLEYGIFLTPDPLEYVDGYNPYIYCGQNPWGKWDPLGLAMPMEERWKAAIIVGNTVGIPKAVKQLPENLITYSRATYKSFNVTFGLGTRFGGSIKLKQEVSFGVDIGSSIDTTFNVSTLDGKVVSYSNASVSLGGLKASYEREFGFQCPDFRNDSSIFDIDRAEKTVQMFGKKYSKEDDYTPSPITRKDWQRAEKKSKTSIKNDVEIKLSFFVSIRLGFDKRRFYDALNSDKTKDKDKTE